MIIILQGEREDYDEVSISTQVLSKTLYTQSKQRLIKSTTILYFDDSLQQGDYDVLALFQTGFMAIYDPMGFFGKQYMYLCFTNRKTKKAFLKYYKIPANLVA